MTDTNETTAGPRVATEFDEALGARIRFIRKHEKMSQEALGDRLGVSFQQVQKYERGANLISPERLQAISEIFEVRPSWLLTGDREENDETAAKITDDQRVLMDFINSTNGIALATAALQIKSKATLSAIVELVRTLGAEQ